MSTQGEDTPEPAAAQATGEQDGNAPVAAAPGETEAPGAAPTTVSEEPNDTSDIMAAKRLLEQDYTKNHISLNILAKGTNQAVRLITKFAGAATTIGEELQRTALQQGGYKRRKTKKQRTKKQTTKQRKKRRTRRV